MENGNGISVKELSSLLDKMNKKILRTNFKNKQSKPIIPHNTTFTHRFRHTDLRQPHTYTTQNPDRPKKKTEIMISMMHIGTSTGVILGFKVGFSGKL